MHELLTPTEMAEADRLTIEAGPFDGMGLMRRAGAAVAAVVLESDGSLSVMGADRQGSKSALAGVFRED